VLCHLSNEYAFYLFSSKNGNVADVADVTDVADVADVAVELSLTSQKVGCFG